MLRKGSKGRVTLTDPKILRLWTGNVTNKRKTQGTGSWVLESGKFSPVHINLTSMLSPAVLMSSGMGNTGSKATDVVTF